MNELRFCFFVFVKTVGVRTAHEFGKTFTTESFHCFVWKKCCRSKANNKPLIKVRSDSSKYKLKTKNS